ncbi:MAG: hypothetical protein ACI9BD_000525 [Candidatus Marinamargulisbacteria bacterium]|jgi:hypothetical protein
MLKKILSARKIDFSIASDVHLEMFPSGPYLPKHGGYLALCGDIGNPNQGSFGSWIDREKKSVKHVFVVAGNHEYYGGDDKAAIDDTLKQFSDSRETVTVLNRTSVLVEGFRLLGCTLWSHVPDENVTDVQETLADYQYIRTKDLSSGKSRPVTVADTNEWHEQDLTWLTAAIKKASEVGESVIVLTHHAPTFQGTSMPEYEGSAISSGFATPLEYLLAPPVVGWIHGHTHYSNHQTINGVDLVSNQVGYRREYLASKSGFRPSNVVTFSEPTLNPTGK